VEIQPVVNLERHQTEYYEVVQPIRQQEILPPVIKYERKLPMIEKGEFRESDVQFWQQYKAVTDSFQSKTSTDQLVKMTEVKQPIVNESIHKAIIEEIQPIVHQETISTQVIREIQPIHERLIEAPKLIQMDYAQRLDREKLLEQGIDVETRTNNPITEEIIRPIQRTEVQPLVTLDRQQIEIHQMILPLKTQEELPPTIEERRLEEIEREIHESDDAFKEQYKELVEKMVPKVQVGDVEHVRVVKPPIVKQFIHRKVIEEVQPIIHQETIATHIIRQTLPIHEKLFEAPVLSTKTLPEKDLGCPFITEPDRSILEAKTAI